MVDSDRHLRLAVISDLHAYTDTADKKGTPSYFKTDDIESPEQQHPIKSLLAYIRDRELSADVLICCGDLGDKADKRGIKEAWESVQEISKVLGSEHIFGTVGNHDIDSRFQASEYDAKGFLQTLSPSFPLATESDNDKYWARHFAIIDSVPSCRFVVLNSSAFHGNSGTPGGKPEYEQGRISPFTLEALRIALKGYEPRSVNVLICHHHPIKHNELNLGDYDDLKDGQLLLDLLESDVRGDWLVIHGHKHHPKLRYAQGGGGAPIIFSAGSLCAVLPKELQGNARNQFYIVNLPLDDINRFGLVGVVQAWDWDFGKGMRPAIARSGLPAEAGFGYRGQVKQLAASIVASFSSDLQKEYRNWDELLARFPEVRYLLPGDLGRLAFALSELSVRISPPNWSDSRSHFDEFSLTPPQGE
jgi:predicted phosphodiesterase